MNKSRLSAQSAAPLYRQVLDELLADLRSGKYPAGQKLPSEAALVQRFGTSRITIGRALRELKQRGLLVGIPGSGNYVQAAANAVDGLLFGLLIPHLGESEIFDPICRGMASAPEAGEHALLWGHTSGGKAGLEEQAMQLCQQFIARKVAGVFFAPLELTPHKDEVNAEICALLDEAGIAVILLDRCIRPFPYRSRYDLVGIDNRRAGYLATEHLIELGCRDVAFLGFSGAAPTVRARIAGYHEALIAYGISLDPKRVQLVDTSSPTGIKEGLDAASSSAFVCANDHVAGQLMQCLQEMERRVPRDVRVVGIDDVDYARLMPVPLTTIHQPCREIGEAAITAMLTRRQRPDMIPRDILLDAKLVVRKSSGALQG